VYEIITRYVAAVDIAAVAFFGRQSVLLLASYLSRTFQIHGMLIQWNCDVIVYFRGHVRMDQCNCCLWKLSTI